ncbi:MAG: YbhB/YbcL family Raf kinase inhibitor-like protein [Vulcanimicrobiaceae bacterium]
MIKCVHLTAVLGAAALAACSDTGTSTSAAPVVPTSSGPVLRQPVVGNVPALTVSSTTFGNGAAQPTSAAFGGCGGQNVSPQLSWSAGPATTKSYVVTEFDPDAPTGSGFYHWTVFNIPATVTALATGFGTTAPTDGTTFGLTDYGASGYGGPCPPVGDAPHRYTFTVSATDLAPPLAGLSSSSTGAFLVFNLNGHVLAQGTYVGTYAR